MVKAILAKTILNKYRKRDELSLDDYSFKILINFVISIASIAIFVAVNMGKT